MAAIKVYNLLESYHPSPNFSYKKY